MTVSRSQPVPPAVAVLAGARDRYHLPIALAQADLLDMLVTELYWPADRAWFASTAGRIMPARYLDSRFAPGLSSDSVQISKRALLSTALSRLGVNRIAAHAYTNAALSRQAGRRAFSQERPLFAYSYYAFHAFSPGQEQPAQRFLFQLHPHPASVRQLLSDEVERTPIARASLMNEPDLALQGAGYERLCAEPRLANGWVVASSYTARTLAEQGTPADRIHVVPYGVDHSNFPARSSVPPTNRTLTAIFVGSMVQRKGLTDLLDAARLLHTRHLRIVLCGRGFIDRGILNSYPELQVEVHIGLPIDQLVNKLQESDVFILPSLVEGFAHVILEAMSTGLPVITTDHTAGPDVIDDGVHGFIVPIRSPEAIAERLEWALTHRDELGEMGRNAAIRARIFTWERFHGLVLEAYREMYYASAALGQ